MAHLKRVAWAKYIIRKAAVLAVVLVGFYFLDKFEAHHVMSKGGEAFLASVIDHFFFGVPVDE